MHVIVDSNIIIRERFGLSVQFRELLSTLSVGQHRLYVSKVVIEEAVAEFERVFDKSVREVQGGFKTLSGRLGIDVHSNVQLVPDKGEMTTALRKRLEKSFFAPLCSVLEYPNTSHELLVKRASARRKPFKESGSGYRDSLIWETTLNLASKVEADVALISNNSRDFGDENVAGNLHPSLIEDMGIRGLSKGKIVLYSSISDFMKDHVSPILAILQDFNQMLSTPDLEEPIILAIQETLSGVEWSPEELNLPEGYEAIYLDVIEGISEIEVTDARELPDGKSLVSMEANLDCSFTLLVSKMDYQPLEDIRELSIIDPDWNRYYSYAAFSLSLLASINLVLENFETEQRTIEVLSFEPIHSFFDDHL